MSTPEPAARGEARLRLRRAPSEAALLVRPVPQGGPPHGSGFTGRCGEVLDLGPRLRWLGADGAGTPPQWEAVGARAIAGAGPARRVALDARGLPDAVALALATGAMLRAWRPAPKRAAVHRVELLLDAPEAFEPLWREAEARLEALRRARGWVAAPANRLTPSAFAAELLELRAAGLEVEVLDGAKLRRLGAGGLLAVGQGAADPPCLVLLRWPGRFAAAPVAFIGKGLCFDTGGISIKPAQGMEEMRGDMACAAACAGAMLSLARRNSPCPAVAVLALAENATGAASYRPGDVLRMAAGRTVEVIDTDAEGRLVLADALHIAASRFRPQALVSVATLTGSVVTALGHHRAGLFGNDAALGTALAAAGEAVGERLWPLPIGEAHRRDLDSPIADLRQCAPAGPLLPDASHAAAFLREFVGRLPWAHLDIAGVARAEDDGQLAARGMPTGFGVRLLDAVVARHFEDPHRL